MANTITNTPASTGEASTISSAYVGEGAFSKLFTTVYTYKGTVSDQDAVAATAIGEFDVTVTGVAFNDIVLGISIGKDLDDGTDQCSCSAHVSAANTVTVQLEADDAQYAADDLNTAVVKMLIGRPSW